MQSIWTNRVAGRSTAAEQKLDWNGSPAGTELASGMADLR